MQDAFVGHARALGFIRESKGLFASYETSALRPDYYRPLDDTGILLEVERGKTTINNMDLLDFWKCHLCEHANYLFLMVPLELRQNPSMPPRREYATVVKRLSSFFVPRNYTNVRGSLRLRLLRAAATPEALAAERRTIWTWPFLARSCPITRCVRSKDGTLQRGMNFGRNGTQVGSSS